MNEKIDFLTKLIIKIRRSVRSFSKAPSWEKKYLLVIFYLLVLIDLRLRLFGYQETLVYISAWAQRWHKKKSIMNANCFVRFIGNTVSAVARWVPGAHCLRRTMTIWALMKREGFHCTIKFAARFDENHIFQAHAWAEYNGVPISDPGSTIEDWTEFHH